MAIFVCLRKSTESDSEPKWYELKNIYSISTGERRSLYIDMDKFVAWIPPVREMPSEDFNDLKDAIMSSAQRQIAENKTIGAALVNSFNTTGNESGVGCRDQGSRTLERFVTEMLSHPKGDAFSWMQCPKELRETLQDAFSNSPGLKEVVEEIFP